MLINVMLSDSQVQNTLEQSCPLLCTEIIELPFQHSNIPSLCSSVDASVGEPIKFLFICFSRIDVLNLLVCVMSIKSSTHCSGWDLLKWVSFWKSEFQRTWSLSRSNRVLYWIYCSYRGLLPICRKSLEVLRMFIKSIFHRKNKNWYNLHLYLNNTLVQITKNFKAQASCTSNQSTN